MSKKTDVKELSLRDEILGKLSTDGIDTTKREHSVMTRLSSEFVEILDSLVKLEIFRSRSEAVAAMVMKTILAEHKLFKQLKEHADKLDEIQDSVKGLALRALKE
ncbi:MAG: hypothetical protein ACXABY_11150 [Candidatus Thorarchaeota archaeon]|jgi:Arc/MetJ-type ribon-helix-helix transcriptional regulator